MYFRIMSVLLICSLCANANAGLWDTISAFFGSEESTQQESQKSSDSSTQDMIQKGVSLIPLLTQTLGVSDDQAKGGMGSLLQAAKLLLSGTDYGKLLSGIPNASSLINLAPAMSKTGDSDSSGGLLGSAMDIAASQNDTMKAGTQLLSQFEQLGLSADMIPKFANTANKYFEDSNNTESLGLLDKISAMSNLTQ